MNRREGRALDGVQFFLARRKPKGSLGFSSSFNMRLRISNTY